jgi:hypothetical protein
MFGLDGYEVRPPVCKRNASSDLLWKRAARADGITRRTRVTCRLPILRPIDNPQSDDSRIRNRQFANPQSTLSTARPPCLFSHRPLPVPEQNTFVPLWRRSPHPFLSYSETQRQRAAGLGGISIA